MVNEHALTVSLEEFGLRDQWVHTEFDLYGRVEGNVK